MTIESYIDSSPRQHSLSQWFKDAKKREEKKKKRAKKKAKKKARKKKKS